MKPPKRKRTLHTGCSGKDVQAVQRALVKGLAAKGQRSVLSPTGTFGEGTQTDMQTFQRCHGITASGEMGQPTLDALWPHVDAYGTSLYLRAKLGQPTTLPQPIRKGAKGDRVRAAQQAFWRMRGADTQNIRNGVFGDGLQRDVAFFADATDQKLSTDQITQGVWECIWAFMDAYAMSLAGGADEPASAASQAAGDAQAVIRSNLISLAETYCSLGADYSQHRPYDRGALTSSPRMRGDCSGSIHRLFQQAGAPDPSGNNFDGTGYTGTMQTRGTKIELASGALAAGDCVFYGEQGATGVAQHVCVHLGSGRLFSFGANPPTLYAYDAYWTSGRRADIGARRYF